MQCCGEFGSSEQCSCERFLPDLDEFFCSSCHHSTLRHQPINQTLGVASPIPTSTLSDEVLSPIPSPLAPFALLSPSSSNSQTSNHSKSSTKLESSKKKTVVDSVELKQKRAKQWVYVRGLGFGTLADDDQSMNQDIVAVNLHSLSGHATTHLSRSQISDTFTVQIHTYQTRFNQGSKSNNNDQTINLFPSDFNVLINPNMTVAEALIHPLMDCYARLGVVLEEDELRLVSRGRELVSPPQPLQSNQPSPHGEIINQAINQAISQLTNQTIKQSISQSKPIPQPVHPAHTTLIAETHLDPLSPVLLVYDPQSSFTLDPSTAGPNLLLAADGLTVTIHSDAKWCSIRSTVGFNRGQHEWRLKMNHCVSGNVFVGVCTEQAKMTQYLGNDAHGFGFYGCGNTYRQGSSKSYGAPYRTGDIITVLLDCDAHTLSFKRQSQSGGVESLGVAFDDLPTTTLFPAISLYSREDSVTILESI